MIHCPFEQELPDRCSIRGPDVKTVMQINSDRIRKQKFAVHETAQIESMIRGASVCRLGLRDGEYAYIVPMNFGYESGSLYFHMGADGKKIECIRKCPDVAFEIDLAHLIQPADQACAWDMQYACVMGRGRALFINDREQKIRALNIIMKQYSDREWIYPPEKADKTTILQVIIETISAKCNMKEKT